MKEKSKGGTYSWWFISNKSLSTIITLDRLVFLGNLEVRLEFWFLLILSKFLERLRSLESESLILLGCGRRFNRELLLRFSLARITVIS